MNCNPCCGCFPPITTYNPSVADNYPTLLQQVEYLKALLKKYPSQQFFVSSNIVTKDTIKITSIKNDGRQINAGDFIFANTQGRSGGLPGDILMFSYTGAKDAGGNYIVAYVGTFGASNDDLNFIRNEFNQLDSEVSNLNGIILDPKTGYNVVAKQASDALSLAQTNETDIASAEARITELEAEASIEVTLTPATATSGTLTDEQYNTLVTNDNCYIKLNEVVYTLSKNASTGVLIYSSKYLSDTKTMRSITVTKATKAWVMTEVSVSGRATLSLLRIFVNNEPKFVCFVNIVTDIRGHRSLTFDECDNFQDKTELGRGDLQVDNKFKVGFLGHDSAALYIYFNDGTRIEIGVSGQGYAESVYAVLHVKDL